MGAAGDATRERSGVRPVDVLKCAVSRAARDDDSRVSDSRAPKGRSGWRFELDFANDR
jgi:hypothetical protein